MPLVVALVAVAVAFAVALAAGSGAIAARARTQGAADLAALAGAIGERRAPGTGCATAREAADLNAVELTSCLASTEGDITVVLRDGSALGPVMASARAGPSFAP